MNHRFRAAFTLVEMLIVISIIATLAAMTAVATKTITEKRTIKLVEAQMRQVELAILDYKTKFGFFPPDNGNQLTTNWTAFPPLFYELTGVVPVPASGIYRSVLGNEVVSRTTLAGFFGREGLANSTDENRKNFFTSMLPLNYREIPDRKTGYGAVKLLVAPAKGPDIFGPDPDVKDVNPWRYNSTSPTNNPGSFDLWAEITFQNKTVVVGNWKRRQR